MICCFTKRKQLLIAPEGIEMVIDGGKFLVNLSLLIAPEGIEIGVLAIHECL